MEVLTSVKTSRPNRFVAMAVTATTSGAKKKGQNAGEAEAMRKKVGCMNELKATKVNGLPVLTFAARDGHRYLLNLLVEYLGFDPNSTENDITGKTCLHYATQSGHLELVKDLVEKYRVDMNAKNGMHSTAVHLAVYSGKSDALNQLLDYGAVFGQSNFYGKEIHAAAFMGNFSVLEVIWQKFPTEVNSVIDGFCTPLLCAIFGGSKQCEELIIQVCTADVGVMYNVLSYKTSEADALRTISALLNRSVDPNLYNEQWYECKAVIVAAKKKWLQILHVLLDTTDPIPGVTWTENGIIAYVESEDFMQRDTERTATRVQYLRELMLGYLRSKNVLLACLICKALKPDMPVVEWDRYDSLCEFLGFFGIVYSEGIELNAKLIYEYAIGLSIRKEFDWAFKGGKGCLALEPNNAIYQQFYKDRLNEITRQSTSN